ncbi:hypothetical protein BC830DRAFT_653608 [Chytriomyces sp. MP71]|nr:hypothetical protein BC830DRAFT_653608 [Chytriomyces sp. MP71]
MRSAFFALVVGAVAATLVAAAVSSYVSYRVTRGFAVKIVSPIEDMTDKLGRLGQNELALEFGERPPLSSELQQVFDNFRNLLTAVRFGNKAYYADDMQLALENYLAAEAMMIRFGNLRGEGVCANNLGGVYRMLEGEFEKALQKYQRSIEIATTLLEAESNAQTPELLKKDLAVRLNNLGVLHKDTIDKCTASPQDVGSILAESLFHRSLDLHRQTDNLEGIAQVSGNLGQLYLATDRLQEAEELLTDAFMVAREQRPSDPIALQYACLNMGLLAEARGMWEEAVTWYSYVLQRFDVVVRFVQRACLTKLIMLCLETDLKKGVNRPKLARELLERAQPLFGDLTPGAVNRATKSVMFVLDVSGSMSGSRIKTCRTSINNIIQNHCTDADSISMIKFSNIPFVLFTSLNKRQHLSNMLSQVRDGTIVSGGTAFYDAVSRAVQQITETDPRTKQKWIIALTDGEDNRSRPESARDIERMLCANRGVGVIVITVGELRNEAEIRSQVVNPAGPGKGFLFRSESSVEGISEAFGKAVRVMMGEVVMQDF